ncbi:MAG TPA: aminotransferase class III-fold pyridoxal phosphate-dependent enzyme [Streptosporangiaceae bacterium]|nr:aminotransferase class III-fold pyridoxal phosphate-dependent enzyme [Streptosporangiaceae bacterium]
MPNYGLPPVAISRGAGCRVWDPDGREYLDLIAGIAVSSLGHAHPALVEAVSSQVAQVAHTSNLFLHEREIELAEKLLYLLGGSDPPQTPPAPGGTHPPRPPLGGLPAPHTPGPPRPPLGGANRPPVPPGAPRAPRPPFGGAASPPRPPGLPLPGPPSGGRVFFANSGTEANEAAIKLVRRCQGPERPVIVAAENGFHGRTMGSLALTGKASIREPFGPFGLTVRFVPFGDAAALRAAIGPDCAAAFLEPALGEGGVVPAPEGYLRTAREACNQAGALLVVDEIQSAIGRTGAWFAHQAEGVRPDVLTLAKGLGGGLPIGACIGFGRCGTGFAKGDHGSTFGGNPVACAAALAVLDTIERAGLLAQAAAVGERLAAGLAAVRHPLVAGVRGRGLWLAVALTAPRAAPLEAAARRAGFLVNAVQPDAIRLAPPLILSPAEADEFVAAWPAILEQEAA